MRHINSSTPERAKGITLEGAPARKWLYEAGWSCAPGNKIRISADLVTGQGFSLGRLWRSPSELVLQRAAPETNRDPFIALFAIRGEQLLLQSALPSNLSDGSMFVQSLRGPLTMQSKHPSANLFFISDWARIGVSPPRENLISYDQEYAKLFLASANAVLSSDIPPNNLAFTHVVRGIEMLFSAMLVRHTRLSEFSASSDGLFTQAMHLIEELAPDPRFDINSLSYYLRVSRSTIYRAFENRNTTPAAELRLVRAASAMALLSTTSRTSSKHLREVARSAGFGSVAAMNRALSAWQDSRTGNQAPSASTSNAQSSIA